MIQSFREGDNIECLICKGTFVINSKTLILKHAAEYIICPHCGVGADVFIYHKYGESKVKKSPWKKVDQAMPEEDELVLVTVDGKPRENINLIGAYFLAEYSKEDGWILEGFEHWQKGFKVTYWCALPAPPDCYKAE